MVLLVGAAVIWSLGKGKKAAPKAAHSDAWQVGTGCWWNDEILSHVDVTIGLIEYPCNMVADFSQISIQNREMSQVEVTR